MPNSLNKTAFIVVTFVLLCIWQSGHSQSFADDVSIIKQSFEAGKSIEQEKEPIKWTQAINPLFWLYKGTIGFYQKNISVQIAANCVFETSCSRYSKKLANEFGVIGGSLLSIERLSRCNRISLVETSPLRKNNKGKIIESLEEYHIH